MSQRLLRFWRHVQAAYWGAWRLWPTAVLARMAEAVTAAEQGHLGEICLVAEASLTPMQLLQGMSARERALEVFVQSRVWDTEHNSGVLVYLLLADHAVEIVFDRGLGMVPQADWDGIVASFRTAFAAADAGKGCMQAIAALGTLLRRQLPADGPNPDELPDPVRIL
jgi:uncharacterized membrane protein